MPSVPLPVSSPAAQGLAARGIQALIDTLQAAPGVEPHSLMILRHGYLVAAGWWYPYTPARPHLLYSLSKSFTSTAAALAMAEGLFALDDPVIAHFPELQADVTHPATRLMLVRHLAAMATGHTEDTWERAIACDPAEPVRGFLMTPPDKQPGTVFAYNQSATYTLAAIVQKLTGQPLTQYLRPRLLDPIGAGDVSWQRGPARRELGFSGLFATTDTVARLGQLYLQQGRWGNQQILAPGWVAEATRPQIATAPAWGVDWEQGYGYQFWMARHGYRGDGAFGQYCLVLPEQDAVVAITSQTVDMQVVLDAVWEDLLPAFSASGARGNQGTEADALLADRLGGLALRAPVSALQPPPPGPEPWDGTTFTPAGGTSRRQPSLRSVRVDAAGGGWLVTLDEAGWSMRARLSSGGWAVTEPAAPGDDAVPNACAGGWSGAGTLRFEVVFLETPHRLVITCRLPQRTFDAKWVTAPLHAGSLSELRAPRRDGGTAPPRPPDTATARRPPR